MMPIPSYPSDRLNPAIAVDGLPDAIARAEKRNGSEAAVLGAASGLSDYVRSQLQSDLSDFADLQGYAYTVPVINSDIGFTTEARRLGMPSPEMKVYVAHSDERYWEKISRERKEREDKLFNERGEEIFQKAKKLLRSAARPNVLLRAMMWAEIHFPDNPILDYERRAMEEEMAPREFDEYALMNDLYNALDFQQLDAAVQAIIKAIHPYFPYYNEDLRFELTRLLHETSCGPGTGGLLWKRHNK